MGRKLASDSPGSGRQRASLQYEGKLRVKSRKGSRCRVLGAKCQYLSSGHLSGLARQAQPVAGRKGRMPAGAERRETSCDAGEVDGRGGGEKSGEERD